MGILDWNICTSIVAKCVSFVSLNFGRNEMRASSSSKYRSVSKSSQHCNMWNFTFFPFPS